MTTEITPTTTKTRRNFSFLFALTLVGLLVLICVALSIATPNFATGNNISNLLRQGCHRNRKAVLGILLHRFTASTGASQPL